MANFDNHSGVLQLLVKAQSVERDVREKVREVDTFLNDPQGQWEDDVWSTFTNKRPRYTFDKCNDLVDDIAGEIEQAAFDLVIKPAGGDATKDLAKTINGLVRNIENLSNASDVFDDATRSAVSAGFDAARVIQRWGDNNTFDQELFFDPISDAVNSVWFDHNSVKQTREDAEYVFVLQSMVTEVYKEKFPKGSGKSIQVDNQIWNDTTGNQPEIVVIGEFLYKTRVNRRIVEMNNRSVYVDDEKYQAVKDELAANGVIEKRSRNREFVEVKTRLLDGDDWLTPVQDTVFELLPIAPIYANWKVTKKVPSFWGVVTKKMDAQRVLNYSESRKVEETAFAPLAKILVTNDQVGPHADAWKSLNVSTDPALGWVNEATTPAPFKLGGAELNPGLESVSQGMKENLVSTAGLDLLTGQAPGVQSGVAVKLKQDKGDTRNFKYTKSKQRFVCHIGRITLPAIPKVYDTERQVRIIGEDNKTFELVTLNETIFDDETKKNVTINDLSRGVYDVTCDLGPAFKNRQEETTNAIMEMAEREPAIIQESKDILYGNIDAPGFDVLARRARQQKLLSGELPEDEITDEEKEFIAAQPEPPPDPVQVALEREADNADDKVQLEALKFAHQEEMDQAKLNNESLKAATDQMQAVATELKTQAETLKLIREGMGLETISGPNGIKAFIKQAGQVQESQAEQL